MHVRFIDDLPTLGETLGQVTVTTRGSSAFIRTPTCIARLSLESGEVDWLEERSMAEFAKATWTFPRFIRISGPALWNSHADDRVAELLPTEDGALLVSTRHASTGHQLWERHIAIPEPAQWSEPSPAWPGAQTEEIGAFIADDPSLLSVCLFRQSRRMVNPHFPSPPYGCQTDVIRFDPLSGDRVWASIFPDMPVHINRQKGFKGVWSSRENLGKLDLETGVNTTLHRSQHSLGWPERDGSFVIVSSHTKNEVGVDWFDEQGESVRQGRWAQVGVRSTTLHRTDSGLALQTNEQMLWWLGRDVTPHWRVRAKPYIYRVHRSPSTDVFVGTDGRGGRLLGIDALTGNETLNVKPETGGAGTLSKVPNHDVLVAKFWTRSRTAVDGQFFELSMNNRRHEIGQDCRELLGTWQHGAVCLSGSQGERVSVIDIR